MVKEECARILLFRGADKTLCNAGNETASVLASLSRHDNIATLINNFRSEDAGYWRVIY